MADGLHDAVPGAGELGLRCGLEADLDCIERVSILESVRGYVLTDADITYPTLNFAMPEKTPATKPL